MERVGGSWGWREVTRGAGASKREAVSRGRRSAECMMRMSMRTDVLSVVLGVRITQPKDPSLRVTTARGVGCSEYPTIDAS